MSVPESRDAPRGETLLQFGPPEHPFEKLTTL